MQDDKKRKKFSLCLAGCQASPALRDASVVKKEFHSNFYINN